MTTERIVSCETCGHPWSVGMVPPGRVKRCYHCPPAPVAPPEAPDLQTQLEELIGEVRRGNRNWALDDRIDLQSRLEHSS